MPFRKALTLWGEGVFVYETIWGGVSSYENLSHSLFLLLGLVYEIR
jgi:hypothetical protein